MANSNLSILLTDDGESVEVEIRRGTADPVYYKGFAPKSVRVREPLPTKELFLENMHRHAESGLSGGTVEGVLRHYLQCRYREMSEQVLAIEKAAKRIEKQRASIELVESWMEELGCNLTSGSS